MLRMRLSNGDFMFGIDAENVRRLKDGKPIVIDLKPMGGTDKLYIMYGETMEEIACEIERGIGHPLPPAQPWPGDSESH